MLVRFKKIFNLDGLSKVFFLSVFVLMILLFCIPFVTIGFLTHTLDSQIRNDTKNLSSAIQNTVNVLIEGAYRLSYELATNPSILSMNPEIQTSVLHNAVENNDYFDLLFITGTDAFQIARSSGALGWRGDRFWYNQIMSAEEPYSFVSRSYFSLTGHMPCTSIFIPMYINSRLVGIFGADIRLGYLQRLVEQFNNRENGRFSVILDGEGVVLAHRERYYIESLRNYMGLIHTVPQEDDQGNRIFYEGRFDRFGNIVYDDYQAIKTLDIPIEINPCLHDMVKRVVSGRSGFDQVTIYGRNYYVSYEPIPMPGDNSDSWSVMTFQDKDIAMGVIRNLVNIFYIVIIIILLTFAIIIYSFFTSLKKSLALLEKAKDEAEHANKCKSNFLSTISHEIRTPMNAILGITEILLREKSVSKKIKADLEKMYESGDLLLNLINDMLDLSSLEAGMLTLHPVQYSFPSIINSTTQLILMRTTDKNIEFKIEIGKDIPNDLFGDELLIKQILLNTLSNAFKYTDEGTVVFEVSAEYPDTEDKKQVVIVFRISDTGLGISEAQMDKLFEEYNRFDTDYREKVYGTVLGMNITKSLTDLMKGEISVQSKQGKGTILTVRLPQERIGTDNISQDVINEIESFSYQKYKLFNKTQLVREQLPSVKILIVDSTESSLYVLKGLLLPYAVKTDTVSSGFEALLKIKHSYVYDIIFIDLKMPVMDGIETTKMIRKKGYKGTIIAMAGNIPTDQAPDFYTENSFDDFLSKPIDSRILDIILKKYVKNESNQTERSWISY